MNLHVNTHLFFLILALVLGILATLNVSGGPRFHLGWASFTSFIIASFFT